MADSRERRDCKCGHLAGLHQHGRCFANMKRLDAFCPCRAYEPGPEQASALAQPRCPRCGATAVSGFVCEVCAKGVPAAQPRCPKCGSESLSVSAHPVMDRHYVQIECERCGNRT